jgi:hypothetical protein
MIPGHRNFFGAKLGKTLLNAVEALSPLQIHRGAGARTASSVERGNAVTAGFEAFNDALDRTMVSNGTLWRAMRKQPEPPQVSELFSKYFQGYTLPELAAERGIDSALMKGLGMGVASDVAERKFRQRVRVGTFAGIGAMVGSDFFFGEGNPISSTVSFGLRGAGHTAAGIGLGSVHPLAGSIYLGATAINALRPGDNWGPM